VIATGDEHRALLVERLDVNTRCLFATTDHDVDFGTGETAQRDQRIDADDAQAGTWRLANRAARDDK
jgi:hypothetical protein